MSRVVIVYSDNSTLALYHPFTSGDSTFVLPLLPTKKTAGNSTFVLPLPPTRKTVGNSTFVLPLIPTKKTAGNSTFVLPLPTTKKESWSQYLSTVPLQAVTVPLHYSTHPQTKLAVHYLRIAPPIHKQDWNIKRLLTSSRQQGKLKISAGILSQLYLT